MRAWRYWWLGFLYRSIESRHSRDTTAFIGAALFFFFSFPIWGVVLLPSHASLFPMPHSKFPKPLFDLFSQTQSSSNANASVTTKKREREKKTVQVSRERITGLLCDVETSATHLPTLCVHVPSPAKRPPCPGPRGPPSCGRNRWCRSGRPCPGP
jgi:hypothetical protein